MFIAALLSNKVFSDVEDNKDRRIKLDWMEGFSLTCKAWFPYQRKCREHIPVIASAVLLGCSRYMGTLLSLCPRRPSGVADVPVEFKKVEMGSTCENISFALPSSPK